MREIKFRAWDIGSSVKEAVYFSFGDIWSQGYMDNEKRITCGPHQILLACQGLDNPDIVLEQYTGLKDKNGIEEYQGDRVKCVMRTNAQICEGVIEYNDRLAAFVIRATTGEELIDNLSDCREIEVIGNVHDCERK